MVYPRDPHTNPSQANPDMTLVGVNYVINPDAAYGDHIANTAAICNTSASHTYGNVMAIIEKWLTDKLFPRDLFKTVMAATTLASRQMTHLPNQFRKKEFPVLTLMSRVVFGQEENRFLGNTLINSRLTNTHALWGDGSLIPLAEDKQKRIYIHGHYNRAVMYVDVIMSFNTYSEQINYMSYLHNVVGVAHNQFIRSPLELYIPEGFCELISNNVNIPIKQKDSVYDFLTYMNSIWYYPITYKLKGGSNSDEFFMYYITDIDTVIQDPQMGQGVKDGQIKRAFDISFTIRCDFNTIGYFTLNAPKIKKQITINPNYDNESIVPIFSDVINLDDFQLPIGWIILSWPIFKLKHGENSISIDSILNDSLRIVIDYHLKMGIPMEKFIKIQFRENGQILSNELYYIDWARRMLILSKPDQRRTYRLIVTVSNDYINNLIKELYNLE